MSETIKTAWELYDGAIEVYQSTKGTKYEEWGKDNLKFALDNFIRAVKLDK